MNRLAQSARYTFVFLPALFAFGCAALPEDEATDNEETAVTEQALETYTSAFNLIASHSGKCITVQSGSLEDNANVRQWACDDTDKRRFTLEPMNDGFYRLVAKHSNKCLAVIGSGTADGTDINQWTCANADNQKFKALPMGDGTFSLVSKHSDKCVDVAYSGMGDGVDIWLWSCNGNQNQRFRLAPVETSGNLLYGQWQNSGGQNPTSTGNRTVMVDYAGPTRAVTFDLWSNVDTYLYLLDQNGTIIAQNDDSNGTNSRITATLSTGTYKLVNATHASGQVAEFAVKSDFASLRYPQKLFVKPATQLYFVYDDQGTHADDNVAIWRPDMAKYPGYYSVGDVALDEYNKAPRTTFVVKGEGDVLAPPVDYNLVWDDKGSGGNHDGSFWEPVPAAGYECIGHVVTPNYTKPSTDMIRCIKSEYLMGATWYRIWDDSGSGANKDTTVWQTNAANYRSLQTSHFKARPNYNNDPQGGSRFLAINKSATANDEFRGGAVTGLRATQFAPIVHMDSTESYFPSSPEFFIANVNRTNGFMVTKQPLGCANCTDPAFLDGQRPDQNRVPAYAEIVKRDDPNTDITDVIYWTFYPYNNGKLVCIGGVFAGSCHGEQKRFGNHVGDWEHVTVRFIDGRPAQVYLAQHNHGDMYDIGSKDLSFDDFHPRVYAAKGSHGLYADTGKHAYQSLPNGDVLADYTSQGIEWATFKTVVPFEWDATGNYTGGLDFLTLDERWGNPKQECGAFGMYEAIADECVLNDGPEAPLVKDFAAPSYLELK